MDTMPRVMLCDDEASYRRLIRTVFEPLGTAEYVESGDGDECLEVVSETRVDYILIDLNMPGTDGYHAIPRLRSELPECKIVALSSARAEEAEERCLALGADAYVEKPRNILSLAEQICQKLSAAA